MPTLSLSQRRMVGGAHPTRLPLTDATDVVSWSCGGGAGDAWEAQRVCALGEVLNHALSVAICVVWLAGVGVGLPLGQQEVDQPRQLVGRDRDGLGSIPARAVCGGRHPALTGACAARLAPCLAALER